MHYIVYGMHTGSIRAVYGQYTDSIHGHNITISLSPDTYLKYIRFEFHKCSPTTNTLTPVDVLALLLVSA